MDLSQDNAANLFSALCGLVGIYLLAGGEVKVGGEGNDSDRQIEGKIAKVIAIILICSCLAFHYSHSLGYGLLLFAIVCAVYFP